MKYLSRLMVAAVVSASFVLPASAAEKIKVVAIDGYPAKAMWVKEFSGYFIPEVNKRLAAGGKYELEWQESYGGSIVKPKGVLEGVKLGLGDIGIVTTIFHSSKLPSQSIAAVTPFIAADATAVAKAVDEIAKEFPTMQKEFEKQNQVYLATGVVLDTYQVFSREPISSPQDMAGAKVAGAGMNLRYLEGIKDAAGVRGGLTDFYNMLQDLGAVNSKTVTVNADYWKKLPDEVKEVLKEVAVDWRDHVANTAMKRAEASRMAYTKAGGTIVDVSGADREAWAKSMPDIASDWAATLNKKGEPGSDMLKAYVGKLKAAGFSPIRDWTTGL